MGGAASVKAPPDPESLTPESLGDLVGSIGLKYAELKQHFIDNGIDGHYIMHLKPEEVDETFEALEITSPILKKNLRIKLLELQKGAAAVAGADVASASTVVAAEPEPAKGVATAEPVVVVSADVVSASAVNAEPAAATGAGAAGPEDSTRSGVSSISMPPAAAEDRWWESSRSRRNQSNAPAAASSSSVPPPEEVNVAEKLKEGRALEARSDLDGARECFETALEGSALTVGVENPATMAIVIELARVLRAGGELSAAESFLEHVVRFRAKALGYSHGDTLAAVHQLGLCAAAQGDFVAAKSHYSDALEALERQVRAPGTQPRPYPPYPWLPRPFPALTPLRSPMWRPTLRRW
jgi:tetratricopeptide (TPR) repeat protein